MNDSFILRDRIWREQNERVTLSSNATFAANSLGRNIDVYGECRNFIKFCKEQGIQVTSEAVATVWAAFQTNVALDDDDDEEATLDDY